MHHVQHLVYVSVPMHISVAVTNVVNFIQCLQLVRIGSPLLVASVVEPEPEP